jgi:hypothetical protein
MNAKKMLLGLGVVLLTICSAIAWAAELSSSGFISGNPAFEPDKDRPGAVIYRKPGVATSSYKKILIDPIEIFIAADSEYKGLSPDESKAITDALRQALVKELEPDYPVVDEPGDGVLGIRLAITNVHMQTKKRGLLGYTPIGLVVTTAGNLAGARMELSRATIEAELLDGGTNEQVAALIDPLGDNKDDEKPSWEEIGKRLEYYAKRLRARLEEGNK